MKARSSALAVVSVLSFTSVADSQQYPIMDKVADKVVQKYQFATCDQLSQERAQSQGKRKSPEEQHAVAVLHQNPNMRAAFLKKVAAPIADKLFECGMIP
jgi:hypothetical protein